MYAAAAAAAAAAFAADLAAAQVSYFGGCLFTDLAIEPVMPGTRSLRESM